MLKPLIDNLKCSLLYGNDPKKEVYVQLRRLLHAPAVAVVLVDQPGLIFNSKVLSVNAERLCIDELSPSQDMAEVNVGDCFFLSSVSIAGMVSFSCKVLDVFKTANGVRYQLAMPTNIDNQNRRGSGRVRLGPRVRDKVRLDFSASSMAFSPLILDLSSDGFSFAWHSEEPLLLDDIIEDAILMLPDQALISFDFKICRVTESRLLGQQLYGCQIVNVAPRQQRLLGDFVVQLQRSYKRQKKSCAV